MPPRNHIVNTEKKQNLDINLFKRIWQFILPYKWKFILAILILLFSKGLTSLLPLGVKYGIDYVTQAAPINIGVFDGFIQFTNITLTDISIFLFIVLIIQFATMYSQISITNLFGQEIMRDLRVKLYNHTMNQSLSFFDKSKVGQLITRIVHDVQTLNELFVTGLPVIFGDTFLIISIIAISFFLDYKLALLTLGMLPILFLGMMLFKKYTRKLFFDLRVKLSEINGYVRTAIDGVKIIKVFNKQNKMLRIFKRLNKEYFLKYIKIVKIFAIYFPSVEVFSVVSKVVLITVGGYWVYTGQSSLSNVIAFILYSSLFFRPIRELSEQYNILQSAFASSERIFDLLESDHTIKEAENPVTNKEIKGEIEFKNVTFSYNDINPVLHNISFKINPGEKVAFVGFTGSGKSTIISLINRLYDIKDGEILLDGINIKDYPKDLLRSSIASVLQDVFIFSDTIQENIRLFDPSIPDEVIIKGAKGIQAHPFINQLKDGYQSELGDNGEGLSFGEKQLLAFTRAFIHNSKIIILDEATSNIDLQTEAIIQKNIKTLLADKTAIIIAHRLSTIKKVDKIIVIHKGRIKEVGNHDELIAKQGFYEKLYRLQFQSELETTTV